MNYHATLYYAVLVRVHDIYIIYHIDIKNLLKIIQIKAAQAKAAAELSCLGKLSSALVLSTTYLLTQLSSAQLHY